MLKFETIEATSPADATLIFLHGLGANGFDLMNTIPLLNLPQSFNIRFLFPHAPKRPITVNRGMEMPAWYDIIGFSQGDREDFSGLEESRYAIDQLIENEIARGIKSERIMLGGFSQGGALTLATGLQSYYPLAGLIILSAYFPCALHLKQRITTASRHIPLFMAHGTQDPIVPYQWGETAKNDLIAMDYAVEWHSYPISHEICLPELQAISHFIQQRFLKVL